MQHDDAIGVRHLVAQMRRPQHRHRPLGAQRQDRLEQVAAARRIEADGRLVHQQQTRDVQQRARQFDATAIAAAELHGLAVRLSGKAEPRQLLVDARLGERARDAVQARVKQQVALHRQLEVERRLLKDDAEKRQRRHRIAPHVMAHHGDAAGIRREQARQKLEQRGLTGAIGAEKRHELAGPGAKRNAIQGANRPIALDHIVQEKRRRAFITRHWSFRPRLAPGPS